MHLNALFIHELQMSQSFIENKAQQENISSYLVVIVGKDDECQFFRRKALYH